MRRVLQWAALGMLFAISVKAAVIYDNLAPNSQMAIASRPGGPGTFEIEAADDFLLSSSTSITSASFIGLMVPGTAGTPSISDIQIEIYRVFPQDSNTVRTVALRTWKIRKWAMQKPRKSVIAHTITANLRVLP